MKTKTTLRFILVALALTLFTTAFNPANAQDKIYIQSKEPSEGLYVMSDMNEEKFGYCKKVNGRYIKVIGLKYDIAHDFENEVARVKRNGKWGMINKSEKNVAPFKYDLLLGFGELFDKLAVVHLNDKQGMINQNGQEVVPIKYDEVGKFAFFGYSNPLKDIGLIAVKSNGFWGA
jgi:hypothetical protein